MNYSITAVEPNVVKNTARDDDETTTSAISGTVNKWWYWEVDHISTSVFSEYEDGTAGHTLSSQGVAREKEFDNNNSIDFSRLNVTAPSISGTCSNCDY